MPTALKILLAIAALLASAALVFMSLIALLYAFSYEMPRDQVWPTAITGLLMGALGIALFALSAWLFWSALRPAPNR